MPDQMRIYKCFFFVLFCGSKFVLVQILFSVVFLLFQIMIVNDEKRKAKKKKN